MGAESTAARRALEPGVVRGMSGREGRARVGRMRLASLAAPLVLAAPLLAQALDPGWAKLTPAPALPALTAMAMAWDPVGNDMVVFGGFALGGHPSAPCT